MPTYKKWDPVDVIGGKYVNKKGKYLRPAGLVSAVVKIEGDNQQERTIRLSSIQPGKQATATDAPLKEEIMADIADLTKQLKDLKVKVQNL